MIGAYRFLTTLLSPFLKTYLKKRVKRGKEDPTRLQERFGLSARPRPKGPLLWFHGASVGESLSLLPLIDHIHQQYPAHHVLVTTGTRTSAALMADRLPTHAVHQYVPLDTPKAVRHFLSHWQPTLAFWVESELWPTLITETKRYDIPMVLLNGRLSERSFRRWQRFQAFITPILSSFNHIFAQSAEDTTRFQALGCTKTRSLGNLKYAAPALSVDLGQLSSFQTILKDRPLWCAASTHDGDEALAATLHRALKPTNPTLLTLICPRHPERGAALAATLRQQGFTVALRSQDEALTETTDIYIADTMGEMGLWYRLAPIVFIGKSLITKGGQNPLEPARLHCALLCGPHMDNFQAITQQFQAADALCMVQDQTALQTELATLLTDSARRSRLAEKAAQVAAAEQATLQRYTDALAPLLSDHLTGKRP